MNKVLERNLSALDDAGLKKKLEGYVYNSKPVLTTTNGYNVMYNGSYLHSEQNPLEESLAIFQQVKNMTNSIHIVYGLGLGYLFQIAVRDSKGIVVLYEPNLDILHNSFTFVDFYKELSKPNVCLFTDFDKLLGFLLEQIDNSTSVEILSLKSYREMNDELFKEHAKRLELLYGSVILDYGFKNKKLPRVMWNVLKNIPSLLKETPINKYEGLYKDKTAIIVSAGPSLADNIEELKKYQKNAIIFAVGPAVKTLIKNDIKVDFLCIIESYNCSKQVEGLDISDINLIVEPYTSPAIHALDTKNKFLHISSNMPPNTFFASGVNVGTDDYFTMGTVSFTALNTAVKLGFSKIILVGQDLAYIDGQCYSKDSAYEDLVCKYNPETNKYEITALDFEKFAKTLSASKSEETRIKVAKQRLVNLNSVLYSVKSVDGKIVPTEAGYASFIQHFENYAKTLEGIELINTSMKGALINGFKNISLKEAMQDSKEITKPELEVGYEYDLDTMYSGLNNLYNIFKLYDNKIDECGKLVSRLIMDCKRNKTVDKDKLLKIRRLIECYTQMDNNVFKYLSATEDTELSEYLKTVYTYNEVNTPLVVEHLRDYYTTVKKRVTATINILPNLLQEVENLK